MSATVAESVVREPVVSTEQGLRNVSQLLSSLDSSLPTTHRVGPRPDDSFENQLAQVRLGIASSLFLALKAKHSPTATHSLRVAVMASAWSSHMNLSAQERDVIEVAALLHDVGKIGVPDYILQKPGTLSVEERLLMERRRKLGLEVIAACSGQVSLLEIVSHIDAWYNGNLEGFVYSGKEIPLGARIIAIADAFDSLTTEQVYRTALSRERALVELFEYAGKQFDPELLKNFYHYSQLDQSPFEADTLRHWLRELREHSDNTYWKAGKLMLNVAEDLNSCFHRHLLDELPDAAIHVDSSLKIIYWNQAAERLTGKGAEAVVGHTWRPQLIGMSDTQATTFDQACPIRQVLKDATRQTRRWNLTSREGESVVVEATLFPVQANRSNLGVTLLLHDASTRQQLEERVHTLNIRATRDQLTGAVNRAEFDRLFDQALADHLSSGKPCSLIIGDLDFFKKINDEFGHPVGDEVIKFFAKLLMSQARAGDIVARFGGEEFLVFCPDCPVTAAARLAEKIRLELAGTAQPMLGGRFLTASFGVTELQPGDDPHSMLARADRGLLQAKDSGRNQVIQLGVGMREAATEQRSGGFLKSVMAWLGGRPPQQLIERDLVTSVPLTVTVEKLKGFVADHQAEILSITAQQIIMQIDGEKVTTARRSGDRCVPYIIEVYFSAMNSDDDITKTSSKSGTQLRTLVRPKRDRDRRASSVQERANQLFASLKSYLVAREVNT